MNGPTMATAILAMDGFPDRDYSFVNLKGETHGLSFPELGLLCRRLGAGLLEMGILPKQRIAIVSREPFDSVRSLFAAFAAGIVPVLVYPPNILGDNTAYFDHLHAQLTSVGVGRVLMDETSLALLGPKRMESHWKDRVLALNLVQEADPVALLQSAPIHPQDPALLQFTSGSGSLSKAVVVSHQNLFANSHAILIDGLAIQPGDRAVCWLPLYHDMGLIGHVVAPAIQGLSVSLYPTSAFLKRPGMWMDAVSKHKGTITFAPNFAFGLAARAKSAPHLDLSSLRVLGCGAEPIQPETLKNFLTVFCPLGLNPSAIFPCYGLAEHTLAAAFPKVGEGLCVLAVNARAYREEGLARPSTAGEPEDSLDFVSCGRAFPGHTLTIQTSGAEQILPEGSIGEIVLQGPSVASEYLNRHEETRATFSDGSLRTGDLGFLFQGCLFVTGRRKDLIIMNGRNFDPQHIEYIAEQIPQVREGSAFAFSIPGPITERLVLLYETRNYPTDELDKRIKAQVVGSLGVTPYIVAAQKAHSLPKTTSGKKRRGRAREIFLEAMARQDKSSLTVEPGMEA